MLVCKYCEGTVFYRIVRYSGEREYRIDTSSKKVEIIVDDSYMREKLTDIHGNWWYCNRCNQKAIRIENLDLKNK